MIIYRKTSANELDQLKELLWKEGPNEWNYLTEEGVEDEFSLVRDGMASAYIALDQDQVIGLAVLIDGDASPQYLRKYGPIEDMCFIGDVVVSADYSGQGIATRLLNHCIEDARNNGLKTVLIERHEENLASAGMMRKAGFSLIDTFYDPDRREAGSRNTVILERKTN
ncbi:GNAT family N-acetyltransferase [Hahella ganghwensis]|uniref:GNAT family N-acetyltransferase n=1 Tax=Hahella ganghwensis TaxID=286420 RepID=UPI00039C978A|nr:GNAT family N-acetyltransferase [Hahella ganghwensis]